VKTVIEVEMSLDSIGTPEEEGSDVYIWLSPGTEDFDEDVAKAAKATGLSEVAVRTLAEGFESVVEGVREALQDDLKALWLRMDALEKRLEKHE
jgi:hypothetical protein